MKRVVKWYFIAILVLNKS